MKAARVTILVGCYLLCIALLGYWILTQDPAPSSTPLRTRPPTLHR